MGDPGSADQPTLILACDYGGPYAGGFVPMLRALARAARESGWRVECVFTEVSRDRPWLAELDTDAIPYGFSQREPAAMRVWLEGRLAAARGPAVIHTHFTAFERPALAVAKSRRDTAVIWHVHTVLAKRPDRWARSLVKFGLLGRSVTQIICVSDATARAARRRGASPRRALVVENGIDTARFVPVGDADRAAARSALGLPADGPLLVHFGWSWQHKGGPLFCEVLARLRGLGSDAVGVTVGAGPPAGEIERRGLGGVLSVLAPQQDVRPLHAATDVLMATSAGEGQPFALLETLSCGNSVVATDIPGHRLAGGGPAALRLRALDAESLADGVRDALGRTPAERAAEAAQAHGWVEEHRGLEAFARRMASTYAEVLAGLRGADGANSGKAATTSAGGSS